MKLDDDTVPKPAPTASVVEADGASVLLDQETGALHLLNDTGAAIWERLDGARSVGAIAVDLGQAFGVEPGDVAADVSAFVARLGTLGLLVPGDSRAASGPVGEPRRPLHDAPDGLSATLDAVWVDWYSAKVTLALAERGIESILLKGPAIRRWLYHDAPDARSYLDADLLVSADKLSGAAAVLSELGFEREAASGMEPINLWATSWRRAADGAVVDLHRTLHGCEHSTVDPWPLLRQGAVQEVIGGAPALLPSIPARLVEIALISPADRPWRKWDDLDRALEQVPEEKWREAASLANALGVERLFGYRLSQSRRGEARAKRLGIETAPGWWLRWEADPMLRWVVLLASLPSWGARVRLAKQLLLPSPNYVRFRDPEGVSRGLAGSYLAWLMHVLRLLPGAVTTLARSARRHWSRG